MATMSGVLRRPTGYQSGVWGWITTVDHKRIGTLYLVTSLLFGVFAGLQALLMRLQLAAPDNTLVGPDVFNQLFTMHGLSMIFLVVMPLSAAFFNWIIPLQIGARDVAFPRLNALSYWTFLFGGLLLNGGYLLSFLPSVTGSPDVGWFAYSNLTSSTFAPGNAVNFYTLGLIVLGTASMAAAFNFVVTIINMRAPGMTFFRMPLFTWMTLVTSFLLVTAMPVITVALIELTFDRLFGANFFNPAAGGNPILWQHLFWVFGHPEVYILILPAMGIVSEVLPTFARKPLFGYAFVVYSGIVIGFMSWGVWSHHMFTVGLGPIANSVFAITTMLIAVPTGVKIFNWIATLWKGAIELNTAMLFSIGFIALFIIGGLSGVTHASTPSDYQQQDTYYIVAHFHYVLFGGAIMGLFSGIYYWFPKMSGRLMSEGLGKLHFWLFFVGMNVTFGPMHWLGLDGMPRRIYTYSAEMGWGFWNLVATLGAFVMAVGVLVFAWNAISSLRRGQRAPADPWDGRTLEWAIPSPPPHYNFVEIPMVHSRDPFWEEKYGGPSHPEIAVPAGGAISEHEQHSEAEHHDVHMPDPSYFPIITAFGLVVMSAGFIFGPTIIGVVPVISIVGAVIMLFGIYGWAFEPVND